MAALPCGHGPPLRHHRRRTGRQPGRHHRGPPRRRGHDDRARRRRRRRPPVGLHPVEGHDRHRRGHDRPAPGPRHGPRSQRGRRRSTSTPCASRIDGIEDRLERSVVEPARRARACASSRGTGRLVGPHEVVITADDGGRRRGASRPTPCVLSTGSRPASRTSPPIDGERVLTTRDAYPPPELPEHLVVIGSGVTGVEFVHMFSAFGCEVTLIVSRQQVLPQKDPEVAAVLEDDFLAPGRPAVQGRPGRAASTSTDDERRRALRRRPGRPRAATPCCASARSPTPRGWASTTAGVEHRRRLRRGRPQLPVVGAAHLRRRRPVGEAAAVVGGVDAGPQDRRARHGPARRPAPPPRLREGGVGHLHRARDRRRRPGRGRRLRQRPQGPGDQGAVLGLGQGAHQRRPPRLREDRLRPRHRRGARRVDRGPATRPS